MLAYDCIRLELLCIVFYLIQIQLLIQIKPKEIETLAIVLFLPSSFKNLNG